MIISSIQAENLLKYRSLRLEDLPEHGIIAVSGENESGKSAIGEIISFALFGRTYSLTPDDLRKLVRWGAIQGWVMLRLNANDQDLEVVRHLYRGGEQSARLVQRDRPQEPLARGVRAVNERLEHILGYDFDEYIDTFYLAQREITTPHAHSPSVKAMAGIAPLEQCAAGLQRDIEQDEASHLRLTGEIADLDHELAQLGQEPPSLEKVEQELTQNGEQILRLVTRVGALASAADDYCRSYGGLPSHVFRRGLTVFLKTLIILTLVAIGGLGLWLFLFLEPELWPLTELRDRLGQPIAVAGLQPEPAFLYLLAALALVLLLVWLWTYVLRPGTQGRWAQARQLSEELRLVDELELVPAPAGSEIDLRALEAGDDSMDQPVTVDKPDSERRDRLALRVLAMEATPDEVRAAARHEISWMERGRKQLVAESETLSQVLASAREERDRRRLLEEGRESLARQLQDCDEGLQTLRLAGELLEGAIRQGMDRFNDRLRTLVLRNLPGFTDGRYEYLQVCDDLGVRVYSNEKRSFLDLEEISAGTQRQIMLALRLALSQERMSRISKDRQFAFLDEPFAFFDDTRMRGALRLLSEVGDFMTQYWVVAQRFPRDEFFALEIPCGRHPDTLEVGVTGASGERSG